MSDHISTTIQDGVATVVLNRPEVLNALNPEMAKTLNTTTAALAADTERTDHEGGDGTQLRIGEQNAQADYAEAEDPKNVQPRDDEDLEQDH